MPAKVENVIFDTDLIDLENLSPKLGLRFLVSVSGATKTNCRSSRARPVLLPTPLSNNQAVA